jgi:hypothetical protein
LFQTISYADVSAQSATQEVQQLTVIPLNQDVISFVLSFDGASTSTWVLFKSLSHRLRNKLLKNFLIKGTLNYPASASDVMAALNDLPTLYPEGVAVSATPTDNNDGIVYTVTFSTYRGSALI